VTQDRGRPVRQLPDLSGPQVVELQDALLSNADRLLTAALTVLRDDNIALSRALVILALEESGKAIALHQRRVQIAYAPEGERFVNHRLNELWASHRKKLELVHQVLVDEQYWFAAERPTLMQTRPISVRSSGGRSATTSSSNAASTSTCPSPARR
jgi:AbiV family abortive infection protein